MKSLVFILILCFLSSCSNLQTYATPGLDTFYVGLQESHGTPVEVITQKDFYLWGLLPRSHDLDLPKEFEQLGVVSIARLTYTQEQTWSQRLFSVLSFGMYWPIQIRFRALAKMNDEHQEYEEGRWR